MKRLTIIIFALLLSLSVATPIMAGPKVGKELCFYASCCGYYSLGFKKATKIKGSDGKKSYYAVHGEVNSAYPVSGTAYLHKQDPNTLEVSFSGHSITFFVSHKLQLDMDTDDGALSRLYISEGLTFYDGSTVSFHKCKDSPAPLE